MNTSKPCATFDELAPHRVLGYFLTSSTMDVSASTVSIVCLQSRQSSDNPLEAIDIGETIIALMEEAGFNSSVLWPGYFNCFELYLLAGDCGKARYYGDR